MAVATITRSTPAVAAVFPAAAVEITLRAELIEAVKAEASIKGITLPTAAADLAKTAFRIDSLIAVSILCVIEPIVGFELPESLVRAGGYDSVDSALGQLLPRIKAQWKSQGGAS
jgi:hypothetical protein